jgi:uncharacterized protein YybS (DUF2232 family)
LGNFLSVEAMKVSDALGCIGSAVILLLASAWIPFVGPFFSLLTPLPFLYYTSKSGLYEGVKISVVTVLIIGLISNLAGFPQIIFLCLEFSLLGMIISEIYRRKFTFGYTVFWGTTLMLGIGAVMLTVIGSTRNMGPLALVLDYFQSNLQETVHMYENMGTDQDKAFQFQEYIKVFIGIISKVYPALVIIGTGFVVWINIVISKPLFRLAKLKYPDFGPLDQWRSPELMVWGVIAAGFSLFLTVGGIRLLAVNALIVMLMIYVFHGLSIILFFFNKYRVPPWIRFGAYFLIIIQQIVLVGLATAGLFDQWIDFRKIHAKRESE